MKTRLLKKEQILFLMLLVFGYTQAFYAQNSSNVAPDDMQSFTIEFNNIDGPEVRRELHLSFSETTSDGFDEGYDVKNLELMEDDLNLISNGEYFTSQAYSSITEDKVAPLVLQSSGSYNFTIQLTSTTNMGSQSIHIRDNFTGDYFDLRSGNAFEFSTEEGNFTNRFEIFFKTVTLSQTDFEIESIDVRYVNDTNSIIISNPKNFDIKSLAVYAISGKEVYGNNISNSDSLIKYQVRNLNSGIYILSLMTENNSTLTKKVIIK